MVPEEIWDLYYPNECAAIDTINSSWAKWRMDVCYPDVKCLVLGYCNRGIPCWKDFGEFLRRAFPNLRSLMLRQNYSYGCSNGSILIEKEHFHQFLRDKWLQHIWINTLTDDFGRYTNYDENFFRVVETTCECDDADESGGSCEHYKYEKWESFLKKIDQTDDDMIIQFEEDELALWPDNCFCETCDPAYHCRREYRSPHPPSYYYCKLKPSIYDID